MSLLVLNRRVGESVCIGDSILVTVTDIGGGRVSLAFDAPREVTILREELVERARFTQPQQEPPK